MLAALCAQIEARDPYTRGHSARVTALAEGVAAWIGWSDGRIEGLRIGGALHDVGKLAVPRQVLAKPGPLSLEERRRIELHPSAGARLLERVASLRVALPYVLHHHERWDGRGYPHGLRGVAIPEEARLLAVADAFDAMTSTRPYRAALSYERALRELDRCAGSQFDPRMVQAFLEVWGTGAALAV